MCRKKSDTLQDQKHCKDKIIREIVSEIFNWPIPNLTIPLIDSSVQNHSMKMKYYFNTIQFVIREGQGSIRVHISTAAQQKMTIIIDPRGCIL